MIIYLALLVCIIGLVVYLAADTTKPNGAKVAEIGRIMFWTGLLAFLLQVHELATLLR